MGSQHLLIYQTPVTQQAGAVLSARNVNLPGDTGTGRHQACAWQGLSQLQPNGFINE